MLGLVGGMCIHALQPTIPFPNFGCGHYGAAYYSEWKSVCDCLSRLSVFPAPDQNAIRIARLLLTEEIMPVIGVSYASDRGTIDHVMQGVCMHNWGEAPH